MIVWRVADLLVRVRLLVKALCLIARMWWGGMGLRMIRKRQPYDRMLYVSNWVHVVWTQH